MPKSIYHHKPFLPFVLFIINNIKEIGHSLASTRSATPQHLDILLPLDPCPEEHHRTFLLTQRLLSNTTQAGMPSSHSDSIDAGVCFEENRGVRTASLLLYW